MYRILKLMMLFMLSTLILNASNQYKLYKFKSGIVLYDVKTSSFDNNLNSHVEGIARLVFDKWGLKELKEEDVSEVQSGDFNDSKSKHTLTLVDNGTIYSVDYDAKEILKTRDRDLDLAITKGMDLSNESTQSLEKLGAKKSGVETIAGLTCDVWRYKDQEVCLYKGIPLKIVIQNAGFYSEKKAVKALFNKEIPESEFQLPKFKIIEDEAYSNNQASVTRTDDYISSIMDLKSEMKKKGINLEDNNTTINTDLEKDIINALGKKYLVKQKKYLPSLIDAMKMAKVCISKAQSKKEAENCLVEVKSINDKLGDKSPSFDFNDLNEKIKEKVINALDNEIKNTEVTAKCVNKFNQTTDVIICTEGKLLPQESSSNNIEQNSTK